MQTENNTVAGLKILRFSTTINAPKQKVWRTLWDDKTYRVWTSAFTEGSHAVSDWQEGSRIQFLDGKGSGMYSVIAKKTDNEFISFRHIGEIKDGMEQPVNEKTQSWGESLETYWLSEADGVTELIVELGAPEDFLAYFNETFPKAMQNIKDLAESKTTITIEAVVKAPVEKVWAYWSGPEHITKWNNASDDWHTPHAENDLRVGGKFLSRMEAKDGSFGFDFRGVYDNVKTNELIAYTIEDGRKVSVHFTSQGNETKIVSAFEAEDENPEELQRGGWQAILDSFKKYTETN